MVEMAAYRHDTVLITGATSDIGAAIAARFAALGCCLILHGRNREKLDTLAQSLPKTTCHLMVTDFNDATAIEQAFARIPDQFQNIDLLVNNAGGALGLDKFHEMSLADAMAMIAANVTSLVHISRLTMPGMVQRKRGHVVNITSVAGNWPYPGGNVYGSCKAFAKHLSLAIRCDLQGTNVRVTSVEPGIVETTFSLKRFKGDAAKAAKVYEGTHALSAQDIAETVFWVATLPPHVNVNSIEVMPTQQSWSPFAVERD